MPESLATVRVDLSARRVLQGDRELTPPLTPTQFRVLTLLLRDTGTVVSRALISKTVWGYKPHPKSIDMQIMLLRKRLGPGYITTVRSAGFRWDGPNPGDPLDTQQLRATLAAQIRALGARYPEDAFPTDTAGGGKRTMAELAARIVEGRDSTHA